MTTEGTTTPTVRPRLGLQRGDPVWLAFIRVGGRHVGAAAALLLYTPSVPLLTLCLVSYLARIWAMEAVYHRYFSHAGYRTGRIRQFLLAVLGTQCGQRGPLWWAATHRTHHRFTDTPDDPHTPVGKGFLHAHARWMTQGDRLSTDLDVVADFARYPEMRWINRYYWVPLYLAVPALYWAGTAGLFGAGIDGLAAVLWGGFLPTTLALHMTSLVNSIGHMPAVPGGYRRFPGLRDQSVNRPLLALLMLGAGWHNNHHRYGSAARSGFAWYELDLVYVSLWLLQRVGAISNLRGEVPEAILREGGIGRNLPPRSPLDRPSPAKR